MVTEAEDIHKIILAEEWVGKAVATSIYASLYFIVAFGQVIHFPALAS